MHTPLPDNPWLTLKRKEPGTAPASPVHVELFSYLDDLGIQLDFSVDDFLELPFEELEFEQHEHAGSTYILHHGRIVAIASLMGGF